MTTRDVPSGVRSEVRRTPAYPFTPIDAPVKLDQNESAYDFPEELKRLAVERALTRPWNRYPDIHTDTLAAAIARFEDWDPEGVVVTPGSNVIIKLLTEMAGIGQTVLTVKPTFAVYELEASMLGADLREVSLEEDFSLPVAGLTAQLAAGGPGVFYLTQPHAPTGHLDAREDVR
ncbi:aminotransferase class I/II-fold pyridoxal phosphate-dependent enzyme, partial [Deinococcus pimensis]|uniref:aminotransferase class I/II-fold pyridoxal phosphate-dependent enzyme n=1 Tax=Deinococcus pimensis TaxID=309888 RepID=UPI0004824E60